MEYSFNVGPSGTDHDIDDTESPQRVGSVEKVGHGFHGRKVRA